MTIEQLVQAIIKAQSLMGATDKLVATGGTRIIDSTSPVAVSANSLMAMEDTVISACTGTDAVNVSVDYVAQFNWVNLKAGIPIMAPTGYKITSITLTSGSVAVYS